MIDTVIVKNKLMDPLLLSDIKQEEELSKDESKS